MWNDIETTKDLLNFSVVARTAAQLIIDSGGEPISIGVSGSWGTGKSSLVKMIGKELKESGDYGKFIFLDFNAWLYQGYDDARMALLQSVADKLVIEAEKREKFIDKANDFRKRINWLRIGQLALPVIAGAALGGVTGGPVGAVIGAAGGIIKAGTSPKPEDLENLRTAYNDLQPELVGLLKEKEHKSLPKEIEELREAFKELLIDLDVTLIVLVDDLDRCLPSTAISTLEAMRLLLFLPHTAFVIAADEQMIRSAVRAHFESVDISDDLVTSYFDKLIQVPLRVPHLGVAEVKGYLMLLFAEQSNRSGGISDQALANAEKEILEAVCHSWTGGLTRKKMEEAFGDEARKISKEIDLADQIASIMVSADKIVGNPRLIKRFLNNLLIRDTIAKAQGLTIAFEELVKLQLFERCASPAAFDYLVKKVAEPEDGKATFIYEIEAAISKGESYEIPDLSWDSPFINEWLKLNPKLGETDLRPLLYLSRNRALSLASFDEISTKGRELLEALFIVQGINNPLIEELKLLGKMENERILSRIMRRARSNQWDYATLTQALHITKAFSELGPMYVSFLNEIPPTNRNPAIIPLIRSESWASDMLKNWVDDPNTPLPVKKAIKLKGDK